MNAILRSISFMVLLCETFASLSRFSHQKCGLYGMPPCNFSPSTSGVTPVCATPGKTYCEFVPNYPVHAIRLLLDKWGIDNVNDLIVDETVDDFEGNRFNDIPLFDQKRPDPHQPTYTELPNAVPTDGFHHFDGGYNYPNPNKMHTIAPPSAPPAPPTPMAPVPPPAPRIPPSPPAQPQAPPSTTGYLPTNAYTVNHNPGPNRYWSGFSYSINQRPYTNQLLRESFPPQPRHALPGYIRSYPVTVHHPARFLHRYVRDTSHRRIARDLSNATVTTLPTPLSNLKQSNSSRNAVESHSRRRKRQNPGREQLCETIYQYITPQAAVNSQGNWMYIVNQVDTTRQLVRTETCASSVCSNLCQLPNGYSSRCEQKYVQKRLIALNADGTNLYSDTFWFPSCCACTLAGPT